MADTKDHFWIDKEKILNALNKAFEEGYCGYKETQELVIKKLFSELELDKENPKKYVQENLYGNYDTNVSEDTMTNMTYTHDTVTYFGTGGDNV